MNANYSPFLGCARAGRAPPPARGARSDDTFRPGYRRIFGLGISSQIMEFEEAAADICPPSRMVPEVNLKPDARKSDSVMSDIHPQE